MDANGTESRTSTRDGRTAADADLDVAVGVRVEGYRWVEWSHGTLRGAPIDQPGKFLGHPGDLLSHLYVEASPDARTAPEPYRHLPPYASDAGFALRAGERAGMFRGRGLRLSCSPMGRWRVTVDDPELSLEDDRLPRLLCRAVLRWLDLTSPEEAP